MIREFKFNNDEDPFLRDAQEMKPRHDEPPIKDNISFLKAVREIIDSVPLSEWEKLPTDGSKRIDEILYGAGGNER